jgi:hypothetical protein
LELIKLKAMKKLISFIVIALLGLSTTFAQTQTPAQDKTEKKTTKKVQTTPTNHQATTTGLKKNGTPDMRLKTNKTKTIAKAKAPLKKNGTPDRRYKENKKH